MTDKLTSNRPTRRRGGTRSLVSVAPEEEVTVLPTTVQANVPGIDLAAWITDNYDLVDEKAHSAGAVLFRGFEVHDPSQFRNVMNALSDHVLGYGERSSPRSEVSAGVYTSTEHPADQHIVLHNEQSYTLNWPVRIVFFCETPPTSGGRTPLADSRRVLNSLDTSTVAKFENLGIQYVRNYRPGISLPWQEAFQTDDYREVERYCHEAEIELEWLGDEHLRTHQVRPALQEHPRTGERTWFNHALFFHVTSLPEEVSAGLRTTFDDHDLPYNTFYGDGSPIDDDTLAELRSAYAAETRAREWREGDVLLVENMLAAHGREPFEGPRRVLAAMADPIKVMRGAK